MEAETQFVQSAGVGGVPTALGPGRILLLALIAGLVAGLLGWLGGEVFHEFFPPQTRQVIVFGGGGGAMADGASIAKASAKNSALVFGLAGACVGLCLGLAGGAASRSGIRAVRAGLAGLVLGAMAGAGAAAALVPVFWAFWYGSGNGIFDREGMFFPMLLFSGLWAAIGAAGGFSFVLGYGFGRLSWIQALVVGILGGVFGAVAFEVASGLVFPALKLMHPIPPTTWSRLADRLFLSMSVAVAIAIAIVRHRARNPASRSG